jgi:hypothetical protein
MVKQKRGTGRGRLRRRERCGRCCRQTSEAGGEEDQGGKKGEAEDCQCERRGEEVAGGGAADSSGMESEIDAKRALTLSQLNVSPGC